MFSCQTLDEFLLEYGPVLGQAAEEALSPLHVPGRDPASVVPLDRQPFDAQAHVITAGVKVLNRQKALSLVCEMGTGKTIMGMGIVHSHASQRQPGRWARKAPAAAEKFKTACAANYRALVMCPGLLVRKWEREILETVPAAKVYQIESFRDLAAVNSSDPPVGANYFIIGRDRAKLSCSWAAASNRRQLALGDGDQSLYRKLAKKLALLRKQDKDFLYPPASWQAKYMARVDEDRPWWHHRVGEDGFRCPTCGQAIRDEEGLLMPATWFKVNRRQCPMTVQEGKEAHVCGAQLWQDIPKPRRFSPGRFIKLKMPGYFNYFILDEAHEEKGVDSIQAETVGYIASACDKVIALTGTLIGGYAWHIRTLLFRLGAGHSLVHAGYGWKDEMAFNEKYGRIETRIVEKEGDDDGDDDVGHQLGRGKTKRTKAKYVRPGIVPTLFGEHLVSNCIFLGLDEVAGELPDFHEDVVSVPMGDELAAEYLEVEGKLKEAVKDMIRRGNKKLLGAMVQTLLAYPDYPFGWEEIGYFQKLDGRKVWMPVVKPAELDRATIWPKEQALLERIAQERSEGRQVWVYTPFTDKHDCAGRLESLIATAGHEVKVLRSSAVPPEKREEWINHQGPRHDVIVSHPDLVKTGLDFFDKQGRHNYCTICFYLPGYNLFTLMQAARRAWRIGQKRECRTLYFFYEQTMQERAMSLMGQKAQAANAVSGRFSTEGLAAMAGEDDNMEMAMAKSLAEKTTAATGEALRAWQKLTTPLAASARERVIDESEMDSIKDRIAALRDRMSQGRLF